MRGNKMAGNVACHRKKKSHLIQIHLEGTKINDDVFYNKWPGGHWKTEQTHIERDSRMKSKIQISVYQIFLFGRRKKI